MNEIDLIKQKELIEFCPFSFSPYNVLKLLKARNIFLEDVRNLQNEIRKTDTYQMLADEYHIYMDLLSSFFQQQGITDYMKVNVFYQNLLNLGYLSYQNNYIYDYDDLSDEYYIFECKELYGARVASGTAVCRHTTMMLNNLQNILKNHSYYLSVFTESSRILEEKLAKRLQIKRANHAINLLETEDGLFYGYCSTEELFLNIRQRRNKLILSSVPSSRELTTSSMLEQSQSEELKWEAFLAENWRNDFDTYLDELHNLPINLNNDFDHSSIRRRPTIDYECNYKQKLNIKQLDSDQVIKLEQEVIKQTLENKGEIKEFYNQTREQLYRIHSLYNSIAPLTKEKVKKLVIK